MDRSNSMSNEIRQGRNLAKLHNFLFIYFNQGGIKMMKTALKITLTVMIVGLLVSAAYAGPISLNETQMDSITAGRVEKVSLHRERPWNGWVIERLQSQRGRSPRQRRQNDNGNRFLRKRSHLRHYRTPSTRWEAPTSLGSNTSDQYRFARRGLQRARPINLYRDLVQIVVKVAPLV